MASALQSEKKKCYTERNSLRYREITAQSIQRMQILHRGFFMPAFDRILQLARMEEMGCEFVEVTAHEGARPTHAVWQGRVYHRGGAVVQDGERYEDFEAATGYGTGPGLCGWNCRHNFYPFYKEHWDYIRTKALTSGKSGAIVKQKIEADLREYVHNQLASDPLYVDKVVGENAANGSRKGSSLNELIADALLQKDKAR